MEWRWKGLLAAAGGLLMLSATLPLHAQDVRPATVSLYMDRRTKQIFGEPAPGRIPLHIAGTVDLDAMSRQVEQKVARETDDKFHATLAQVQAQEERNQQLSRQVALLEPAWKSYTANFQSKFRLGALAYLDWALYSHTGYGPYFLENLNPPGVGNNAYNSFDINRAYLNAYFTPTDNLVFRLTPELYRSVGSASADRLGTTSAAGSNLSGDMNLRIKYAYIQYTGLLDQVMSLKGGNVTFGAQQNPFVPWEEDFGQYRFVYLSPWNYVGLSSSQIGLQLAGPVKLYNAEKTYAEYAFGAFNNGNFNNGEQANTKQAMARLTVYPFGAKWRYDGLGITGFYDYGWGNTAPDSSNLNTPLKVNSAHFERIAALLHYATEEWNLLGEFDYGNNAFTLANLYRGSGPADAFGIPTGPAITSGSPANQALSGNPDCTKVTPCYNAFASYGPQTAVYQAFLNNGRSRQLGLDFMGRYHIPETKLTLFGMYQWFMPNDNVAENPLDFERFIAGISYQYNEYLRLALNSQNLLFYHDQFGLPVSNVARFNYVPGSTFNGRRLPSTGGFVIPNLVPRDIHAIFLNAEFAY